MRNSTAPCKCAGAYRPFRRLGHMGSRFYQTRRWVAPSQSRASQPSATPLTRALLELQAARPLVQIYQPLAKPRFTVLSRYKGVYQHPRQLEHTAFLFSATQRWVEPSQSRASPLCQTPLTRALLESRARRPSAQIYRLLAKRPSIAQSKCRVLSQSSRQLGPTDSPSSVTQRWVEPSQSQASRLCQTRQIQAPLASQGSPLCRIP